MADIEYRGVKIESFPGSSSYFVEMVSAQCGYTVHFGDTNLRWVKSRIDYHLDLNRKPDGADKIVGNIQKVLNNR